jgi:hypothetical protein
MLVSGSLEDSGETIPPKNRSPRATAHRECWPKQRTKPAERKQSLATDMAAKQDKVNELQQGRIIPLDCLYIVRLWQRDPELLAARCASLKNAFVSMGGALIHHATIPENARQLFYQTWPGWTYGVYRAFGG